MVCVGDGASFINLCVYVVWFGGIVFGMCIYVCVSIVYIMLYGMHAIWYTCISVQYMCSL